MDLLEGMATTRAIRRYRPDSIPDDDLGTICEAVTAAVHACAPASEQAP